MSISKGYDAILAQGFPASYIHHMMKSVNDTDSDIAVRVENLRVRRGGHEILHGLDVALSTGTVTGLLGPSGCGKTTLMRALVGVQRYEAGSPSWGTFPAPPTYAIASATSLSPPPSTRTLPPVRICATSPPWRVRACKASTKPWRSWV